MQSRAFEKSICSITFGLCVLVLMSEPASASTGESVMAVASNPMAYVIGLLVTFVGSKLLSGTNGHF